jgi:hypothetical protein
VLSALRDNSQRRLRWAWGWWLRYCALKGVDPEHPPHPPSSLTNALTWLFREQELSPVSVRSFAMGVATAMRYRGHPGLGGHHLVKSALYSVAAKGRARARYAEAPDWRPVVALMLDAARGYGVPPDQLDLQRLSRKTLFLLRLALMLRSADATQIPASSVRLEQQPDNTLLLVLHVLGSKANAPNDLDPYFVRCSHEDEASTAADNDALRRLCAPCHVQEYLRRTARARGRDRGADRLFLVSDPKRDSGRYEGIRPNTAAQWVRRLCVEAGVAGLRPHGLRAFAATVAMDHGALLADVVLAGHWSNEAVPTRHYVRSRRGADVAQAIVAPLVRQQQQQPRQPQRQREPAGDPGSEATATGESAASGA